MTGRFSAAVGTACEASKTKPPYVPTDVIVDRLWVPFSPCGHRAPVFPSIASGYAIPVWPPIPALPVTLRIASPCQLPASRPAPGVHPRKRGGYHKNSSTEAKIQNDGNRNVDRTVIGGCRNNFSCGEDQIAIQRFASGRIYYAIVWVTYHRYCTR